MSAQPIQGIQSYRFDHFTTIVLPDGRAFQVSNEAIEGPDNRRVVRPDAEIMHIFKGRMETPVSGPPVSIPTEVLARIPA